MTTAETIRQAAKKFGHDSHEQKPPRHSGGSLVVAKYLS